MFKRLFNTPKTAVTKNGDPSYKSTSSALLDFFTGMCRDDKKLSQELADGIPAALEACWRENPEAALKMIFYKRDCRGGAGERKIFEISFRWLATKFPKTAVHVLRHVPYYGSWKDLVKLTDTSLKGDIIALMGDQLKADLQLLDAKDEKDEKKRVAAISLAAKWAPTIASSADRKQNLSVAIAKHMGLGNQWQKAYRTQVLRPLRDHLNILEKLMSLGQWEDINFSHVPSMALAKNKAALQKHAGERYTQWLADVKKGTAKINAGQMMPHQLLTGDATAIEQWNALREQTRKLGKFTKCLGIADVSGSMSGLPMDVACALAILISECAAPPFQDLVISFSEQPRFIDMKDGKNAYEKSETIRAGGGLNTDLRLVFETLLERAHDRKVPAADMPEKIFIVSDMQFDTAFGNYDQSTYEAVKNLYHESGYKLPQVVFWNVKGNLQSFPVQKSEMGVALISGFSPSILKVLLDGDIPDPYSLMMKTLNSERYARISLK